MQETFRAIIAEMGGTPLSPMPTRERRLRSRPRRPHHPRARRHAHGQRSEHLGAQQELSGARRARTCSSPTRARSCPSPTRTPRGRSSRCRCGRATSSSTSASRGGSNGDNIDRVGATLGRRSLLKILSAAPVAASFALTEAEAQEAHNHAAAARQTAQQTGVAFTPKFFTAAEYQTVRILSDLIIPADDRSGGAIDAGVPEFMDFTMVDQPARQVAMRGGLAWLDLECQKRFDKTFVGASAARAHRRARRSRRPTASSSPGCRTARRSSALSRPHRIGLLDDEDGDDRPRIHGQHRRGEVGRLSARAAEKVGIGLIDDIRRTPEGGGFFSPRSSFSFSKLRSFGGCRPISGSSRIFPTSSCSRAFSASASDA